MVLMTYFSVFYHLSVDTCPLAGVTEPTASVLTQQSLSSRLNVAATAQTSAISPGNVANTFGTSLNLNSFDQSHSQQLLSNQQHTCKILK